MQESKLKSNFLFQGIYQVLIYLIPLVVAPYLTRVLKSEALGIYTYVNSIAYYFVIFANLGISRYGQRTIASNKNDSEKCRKVFWGILIDHIIVSILIILIYIFYCVFFVKEYIEIYFIELLYIVSALFDVTWFFYGLENFKSVVIKNTFIKLLECICIFLFVNTPGDLDLYTFIMAGSILLGQVIIFPQAIKLMPYIKVTIDDLKIHIKPMLVLFVSVIASTLYTVFDKTLLGLYLEKNSVAFYEYSNKLINIPKSILAVVGTVMFPRACKAVAEGKIEAQKKYIELSLFIIYAMSIACMFGICAISNKLVLLYFDKEFAICGNILKYMSPLLVIILLGDILRSEYLIPLKKDFQYVTGIALSAVINIIISIILIPLYGVYGAVIGTFCAELFNFIYELVLCKNIIDFKKQFKNFLLFIINGCIMYWVVKKLDCLLSISWLSLCIEIFVGVIIYAGILLIMFKTLFRNEWKTIKRELKK